MKETYLIAYFLSKYDLKGTQDLGFKNRTEAFKKISRLLGNDNHSLKLRRDEFDVVTGSSRVGFIKREPRKYVIETANEYNKQSYEEVLSKVLKILNKLREERFNSDINDVLYIKELDDYIKTHVGEKIFRNEPIEIQNNKLVAKNLYKRNLKVAANSLRNADYKCEICSEHLTFIRKTNFLPYTEPHHLIPMEKQKYFKNNIDIENNIISLCSNCHNKLHYGTEIEDDLLKLFTQRKQLLAQAGIIISFNELLEMYK